ncbi:MAG TPA: (2Fe-2S) ferredoxin domain-containing protein [Rectinemataceae bacterium]|nr:(2Fe-2S) ferredoxin domain-containing protein [Rectinemataceae bacterium]
MAKMNVASLDKHRAAMKAKYPTSLQPSQKTRIIVGMGTCGIAAGARDAWEELKKSIAEFGIEHEVLMKQTGCMGLCQVEPTVEIAVPGMPTVIYGKVTAEVAKRLVRKHIVEKTLIDGHIQDRPATDIVLWAAKGGE